MPNYNKLKGTRFEYEWMYFMMYHHFDNVRSYASIGVADVRSIPPRWCKNKLAVAAQCKFTKKGDYINPDERKRLEEYSKKFSYLVVEPLEKRLHQMFSYTRIMASLRILGKLIEKTGKMA